MSKFSENVTTSEMYGPAMEITDEQEAEQYLQDCIDHMVEHHGQTEEEARRIQLINIGYYAGYYDSETMSRVNRLFKTQHPVFGSAVPTPEEALRAGQKMAMKGD